MKCACLRKEDLTQNKERREGSDLISLRFLSRTKRIATKSSLTPRAVCIECC